MKKVKITAIRKVQYDDLMANLFSSLFRGQKVNCL